MKKMDIQVVQTCRPFKEFSLPLYTLPMSNIFPLPAGNARIQVSVFQSISLSQFDIQVTAEVALNGQITLTARSLLKGPEILPEEVESETSAEKSQSQDSGEEEIEDADPTFAFGM